MTRFLLLVFLARGGTLMACAGDQQPSLKPKQAMFKTQAEAEAAAADFGCTGAHKMGEMWMVCDKHDDADHNGGH